MNSPEYDLRRLQLEQLSVLDEFTRVCRKHNLTFYLAYGSCLGAVRHHGFIPWDDDIDILMPVCDYDALSNLADEFGEGFFLQNSVTDPYFRSAISRLRKRGTACVEEQDLDQKCHQGIFIDIYPQYQYPDGFLHRLRMIYSSLAYRLLLLNRPPANHGRLAEYIGQAALRVLSIGRDKRMERCYSYLRSAKHSRFVADLYGMDLTMTRVIKYPTEWFQEPQWVEFEGRMMPVPTNAKAFLMERYGDDCLKLPPPDRQHSYHCYAFVSFDGEYKPSVYQSNDNEIARK